MLKHFQLLLLIAVTGCSDSGQPVSFALEVSGRIEDGTILEASGLARSQHTPGLLWLINDNGNEDHLHALGTDGKRLGEFELKRGKNRDWEDLGSFAHDERGYLMVADIGNNDARHEYATLYFVPEPDIGNDETATTGWKVNFRYPEGPRDAESAAIDLADKRALVLTKRDLPPLLYSVPMQANSDDLVDAELLGPIHSLTTPSNEEIAMAPKNRSWWWQPVAMDISQDGMAAVILTYRAVFYFERQANESWYDALNGTPYRISLGNFENAEAVAFADNARTVIVTGENKHSRLLRVDLEGALQHD